MGFIYDIGVYLTLCFDESKLRNFQLSQNQGNSRCPSGMYCDTFYCEYSFGISANKGKYTYRRGLLCCSS